MSKTVKKSKKKGPSIGFSSMCRACLKRVAPLFPIKTTTFSNSPSETNISAAFVFEKYCSVKIEEGDKNPQSMCRRCIEQAFNAFDFFEMFIQSQNLLKKIQKGASKASTASTVPVNESDSINQDCISVNCDLNEDLEAVKREPEDGSGGQNIEIIYLDGPEAETPNKLDLLMVSGDFQHSDRVLHDHHYFKELSNYVCRLCDVQLHDIKAVLNHLNRSHRCILECLLCTDSFLTYSDLVFHIAKHSPKSWVCERDRLYFPELQAYQKHCKSCGSCKESLRTAQSSKPTSSIRCEECNECFRNKNLLAHHMKKHGQVYQYKCSLCELNFDKLSSYMFHLNTDHEKAHVCHICGKSYVKRNGLRQHILLHKRPRKRPERSKLKPKPTVKLICSECDACVSGEATLKQHMRKHGHPFIYSCAICFKNFEQLRSYQHHLKEEHEKRYFCRVCGKGFALKAGYYSHHRRHKLEKKKVNCDECGRNVYTRLLKSHKALKHPNSFRGGTVDIESSLLNKG